MKKEIIGILGGMGPEASAYLYKNVIKYCQEKFNAIQDTDYPHMIINSIGLEGFDETGICDENLVKQGLLEGILQLDIIGTNKIYMACNTVHKYINYLQKNSKGNIVNLLDETSKMIFKQEHKKILILGSSTTNNSCLYDNYLSKYGIDFIKVNTYEQAHIDNIIENIMGGNETQNDNNYITLLSNHYAKKGATGVIIGCTELPLVTNKHDISIDVFDTLEILTELISLNVKKTMK